ncbi:ubiquinol oxidase subunit II [Novosphingobium sp. RD2P27]|uniref:Ubiquinol oxidase polypeptide II n=1 Tax=Novosphingobium kalidii TaxID=3230299 RepID=A0ABV2CX07_9SPHN
MVQQSFSSVRRLRTLATLPLLGLLAACNQAVLDPAGDVARQQRDIIYISTGLMLVIIVPVMILIVVFAWRYRKGKGGTYDPEFDHSTTLELVIWSAPLLIIIMLGALTWSSTHLLDPFRPLDRVGVGQEATAPAEAPLRVQVVALDWKWLFIYPEQGIATVNELVLPVNREVRFDITSSNMMNTFYAPTMAGMIYAMPGMQSTLHAVLDRPVVSEGFSANYSGAGFSDMRFRLHGVADARFQQWVRQVKQSGRVLDTSSYQRLAQPSERVPAMHFAGVNGDLFQRVVERCVEPGKPCMSELMRHGQSGGHTMTPRGETLPQSDDREGHLIDPSRKTGARPVPGTTVSQPGVISPEAEHDRDLGDTPEAGSRAPAKPKI